MVNLLKRFKNYLSLKLFSNTLGLINIYFSFYWFISKLYKFNFFLKKNSKVTNFKKSGFVFLQNVDITNLKKKTEFFFEQKKILINPIEGVYFLNTDQLMEIKDEISKIVFSISDELNQIYSSNFKIYFTNIQRSYPIKNNVEKRPNYFILMIIQLGQKKYLYI